MDISVIVLISFFVDGIIIVGFVWSKVDSFQFINDL
jgi:hypothetical protein